MKAEPVPSRSVGVIAVNWNDTVRSVSWIESVQAARQRFRAILPILVDNGSEEDPTAAVRRVAADVEVVRLGFNRGYAAGCNAGAARAMTRGAAYLFFLNNDATIEPSTVPALLDAAGRYGNAILGPKIVYAHDPEQIWSAGGQVITPDMRNRHVGQGDPVQSNSQSRQVDWTTGCALFVAAQTYRRLGPMDEKYFLYLEDIDWCLRGKRMGIPTYFIPESIVRHEVSASAGSLPPDHILYYACRNTYRLAIRNNPIWRRPLVFVNLWLTLARTLARNAFFPAYREDSYYQARTAAVIDAVIGRWGPVGVLPRWRRKKTEIHATLGQPLRPKERV